VQPLYNPPRISTQIDALAGRAADLSLTSDVVEAVIDALDDKRDGNGG
jgi:hypothetical protein